MNKTNTKLKPIARLPDDSNPNDSDCTVCGDDNLVSVITGDSRCHYCGNQINLCSKCHLRMLREAKECMSE